MSKKNHKSENVIAQNRKASHEYFIENTFEAGMVLNGWELKSIRAGKVQLVDSYVKVNRGELWLLGSRISPLLSASTHVDADPTRTRKLLLHKKEINKLIGFTERKGFTLIIQKLYWKKQLVKAKIALVKGKKLHEKKAVKKEKDLRREQQKEMKNF